MTPITPWALTSYTTNTWTDLVSAVAAATVIKSVSFSVGANAASVQVRIVKSDASTVMVVPASALDATSAYGLDIPAITLGAGDALQIKCSVSGVEFAAFGAQ